MAGQGWRAFTRETLSSTVVQQYLMDQSVMVFDSASQRGSELVSPAEGMVTYRKDADRWEGRTPDATWKPFGFHWGAVDTFPVAGDGAVAGDTAYVNSWGCNAIRNTAGNWKQVEIPNAAGAAARTALATAATAAGVTLPAGFRAWDSGTDRMWAYTGSGTAWTYIGGPNGTATTDTNALAISGGWTLVSATRQILGNHTCYLAGTVTRSGAALVTTTTGDLTNVTVGSVGSTWEAARLTGFPSGSTGRMATFYISGTVISLASASSNINIATGEELSFAGTYPLLSMA
jgi:hypothetical protein